MNRINFLFSDEYAFNQQRDKTTRYLWWLDVIDLAKFIPLDMIFFQAKIRSVNIQYERPNDFIPDHSAVLG